MTGVRVYELSKELRVPSKKLIEIATQMGYPVKSHSSSIDNMLADRLRRQAKLMGLETKKPKAAKSKPAVPKTDKPTPEKTVKNIASTSEQEPSRKSHVAPAPIKPAETKVHATGRDDTLQKKATNHLDSVRQKRKEAEESLTMLRAGEVHKRGEDETRRKTEQERKRKEAERLKQAEEKEAQKEREIARKRRKEKEQVRKDEKLKQEKESARIREARELKRKQREEERELQRLIEDEERSKREAESKRIILDEATTVKEFAEKLGLSVNEIIKKLMTRGVMANLNQTIDIDVAKEMAIQMGYEIKIPEEAEIAAEIEEAEDSANLLKPRPPVVTIMGHVDHGKTSLLDTIRKSRVTESEAGGITQRIGAYKVKLKSGAIVFLDTPGHEAFTTMRSRGAAVTDIVVLVVAADDGVMPQTVEAIHHAKAAGVPVLVAVNKMDKPGANPEKIKQELTAHELVPEEWGGSTIYSEVSAKNNVGIDNLLELIILQSEILELKANPNRRAFGTIIESKLDKGRGPVATVLVLKGTLKIGDPFVAGGFSGKVRALLNDQGKRITEAGPAVPVEVLGFSGVPNAGDNFIGMESERKANQAATNKQDQQRLDGLTAQSKGHVKLENLHAQITNGEIKELNIIIKADVQGSIEAVTKALEDISREEVRIRALHGAVGGITETDISLAAASDAIVIGFNVRPTEKARALAEEEEVDVKLYSVIYNAIDDIKLALEGMLKPTFKENVTGRAEVRQTFHITRVGSIAGCMITSGKITRNSLARLVRDQVVVHESKIHSLKRFKDDAKEVMSGYECGIGFENYNDMKNNDVIETYEIEEVARKIT